MKTLKLLLKDPSAFIIKVLEKYPFLSSDKYFLQKKYKYKTGMNLDLKNPKSFNEKLQWLKLYHRKSELTDMADKIKAKNIVRNKIGNEYIIPTLGTWNSFDEINFDKLPNQFVIKTNHDYAGVVICKDKNNFDFKKTKEKIEWHLNRNFYYVNREWVYKNIEPKILIEKMMKDDESDDLRDYKFLCFNGTPKLLYIATDRQSKNKSVQYNFFDLNFSPLKISHKSDYKENNLIKKPVNFDKMIELASKLSKGLPHVRVDFYEVNGQIYFGELTFYQDAGFILFRPKEWEYRLGDFIKLPLKS